ncbi:MAG: RagB/SusD family nutrient uptake outer membrane protein [Pelobium sp.]
MKLRYEILTLALLSAVMMASSCKKSFLDKGIPQDQLTSSTFYTTELELQMATSYLYGQPWFDYNWPFGYQLAEVQSGNVVSYSWNGGATSFLNFAVPSNSSDTKYGWSSLYNVIAHSNTTIINVTARTPDLPAALGIAKKTALGESHFMRAIAYFQLVQTFGPVPIIEDNNKVAADPNLKPIIVTDIYKFIINDLKKAVAYLPLTNTKGHVNVWAAKGLLAKVYLTAAGVTGTREQSSLDSAKTYALDVAANSGLTLAPNFGDLFLSKNNNALPELMFGLQWAVSPAAAYGNNDQRQTQLEGSSDIDDVGGGGWGGFRVSADLAKLYSSTDLRRKATFMRAGDSYPELITAKNPKGYAMTDTGSLYIKKYIIGGPLANGGANIRPQWNNIPTYLLRLADVYLVLAEATLGSNATTSDANALLYFNKVRNRANPTAPALTSLDFKTIFTERRIELAGENQFWFDIKRWHDWNPTGASDFVKGQHRNMASYDPAKSNPNYFENPVANTSIPGELTVLTGLLPQKWTISYPAADLTSNPNLSLPPVPYY